MKLGKCWATCIAAILLFSACATETVEKDYVTPETAPPTEEVTPPSDIDEAYTVRFVLAVEMDGNTIYTSITGVSEADADEPYIHTIETLEVKEGETLPFLTTPTILNDPASRYVFVRWEASDGSTAVTVTSATVLSDTALDVEKTIIVSPVLKKVTHTENYS